MAHPNSGIGIDLGTSNSLLAFSPLSGEDGSEVLAIHMGCAVEHDGVCDPSIFPLSAGGGDRRADSGPWPGSAHRCSGQTGATQGQRNTGRVAPVREVLAVSSRSRPLSTVSWEWRCARRSKISPVDASGISRSCARAWNARFAGQGSDFAFDAQDITITVPASFDAAAQRLTLTTARRAASRRAVYSRTQAAFLLVARAPGWPRSWRALPIRQSAARHILVIDVGGGTSISACWN